MTVIIVLFVGLGLLLGVAAYYISKRDEDVLLADNTGTWNFEPTPINRLSDPVPAGANEIGNVEIDKPEDKRATLSEVLGGSGGTKHVPGLQSFYDFGEASVPEPKEKYKMETSYPDSPFPMKEVPVIEQTEVKHKFHDCADCDLLLRSHVQHIKGVLNDASEELSPLENYRSVGSENHGSGVSCSNCPDFFSEPETAVAEEPLVKDEYTVKFTPKLVKKKKAAAKNTNSAPKTNKTVKKARNK